MLWEVVKGEWADVEDATVQEEPAESLKQPLSAPAHGSDFYEDAFPVKYLGDRIC